jgi:CRAL/TRIO domain
MAYKCPICEINPYSHSLMKLEEINGIIYYYTCPSQARRYDDVQGILAHYDGVLSEIPEDKDWIWIFDSYQFGFIHAFQFSVARELALLINRKFSKNLKKIIIINPTLYINLTHTLVIPFLNRKVQELIEIDYSIRDPNELLK